MTELTPEERMNVWAASTNQRVQQTGSRLEWIENKYREICKERGIDPEPEKVVKFVHSKEQRSIRMEAIASHPSFMSIKG